MNYYDALQVASGPDAGRWDYTCHNDRTGTYRVGYCRGWHEETREELDAKWGPTAEMMWKDQEDRRPFREHYHTDGHATKEEAYACYKRYLLDHRLRLDLMMNASTLKRCEFDGCGEFTRCMAQVDNHSPIVLCDAHRTREVVASKFEVGYTISSY